MTGKTRTAGFSILAIMPLLQSDLIDAHAQAVADNMTCQQAVEYYERNGRISKYVHGRNVIPIYNGVPVSKRSFLKCSSTGVRTKTLDNPRCIIAYKCQPRTGR